MNELEKLKKELEKLDLLQRRFYINLKKIGILLNEEPSLFNLAFFERYRTEMQEASRKIMLEYSNKTINKSIEIYNEILNIEAKLKSSSQKNS